MPHQGSPGLKFLNGKKRIRFWFFCQGIISRTRHHFVVHLILNTILRGRQYFPPFAEARRSEAIARNPTPDTVRIPTSSFTPLRRSYQAKVAELLCHKHKQLPGATRKPPRACAAPPRPVTSTIPSRPFWNAELLSGPAAIL